MAKANLVQKHARIGHREIIKFQILTHCFMKDINLSNSELDCLTLLGAYGEYELAEFCAASVEEKIFKTPQSVRNFLTRAVKKNLVNKKGSDKKKISLDESLKVQSEGNIVLDYKIVYAAEK